MITMYRSACAALVCSFMLASASFAQEAVNLGPSINSGEDDYGGWMSADNSTIYFASTRKVESKEWKALNSEIFYAEGPGLKRCEAFNFASARILDAVTLQGVKLGLNQGAIVVSHDRTFAVFAAERTTPSGGQSAFQDIYEVSLDKQGRPTGEVRNIKSINSANAWDSQPALSPDDQYLIFTSDRARYADGDEEGVARRDFDLYVSKREAGVWGKPRNMTEVNTTGDEVSPFVSRDVEFYFASSGSPDGRTLQPWHGKRDIFKARVNGETVSDIVRLDRPFNSPENDEFPYISQNGRLFLFTSDRPGGLGKRDIYSYCQYVAPRVTLRGKITQRSEEGFSEPVPLTARVNIRSSDTEFVVIANHGEYFASLAPGKEYQVTTEDMPCFRVPNSVTLFADYPEEDTQHVRDFDYLSIRQAIGLRTDTVVPFFVTGYWYPNTPANYAALNAQASRFSNVHYIHKTWQNQIERDDNEAIDYRETSATVGAILDQAIYSPTENMLNKMINTPCNDSGLVLNIDVTGFCDERRLLNGPYRGETVEVDNLTIDSTMEMNKDGYSSPGNSYLSKLRAYFTLKTIDRDLAQRSQGYRTLKQQKRVVFSCSGNGVDKTAGSKAQRRRVDIRVSLLPEAEATLVKQTNEFPNRSLYQNN